MERFFNELGLQYKKKKSISPDLRYVQSGTRALDYTENFPILIFGILDCNYPKIHYREWRPKFDCAFPSAHFIFDAMSWFTVWIANRKVLKESKMDPSALLKWHLKKAARLRRWVNTIKIIKEHPLFSRVPIKDYWSKKLIRDIKIAGRLRLYNMIHVQF
jgi:hypothetical protein